MSATFFRWKNIWLWPFCLLLLSACEEEVILDIAAKKQLVLFSNFSPDSLFQIHLSTAVPLADTVNRFPLYPEDARIQLSENGNVVGNFTFQDRDSYSGLSPVYVLNHRPKPGSEYTLTADVLGYPAVSASSITPEAIAIQDWEIVSLREVEEPSYPGFFLTTLRTKLNLSVPNTSQKYFHLLAWYRYDDYVVYGSDTTIFGSYLEEINLSLPSTIPQLPIFHEPGTLVDFSANTNSSPSIELDFTFEYDSYYELKPQIILEIRSVSKDYYLFHKTVGEQEVSNFKESNLSLQSVLIHNNLDGGIGNFSGYTAALDSLKW